MNNSGAGIRFVGDVYYANNINLVVPTVKALKILITICDPYAAEFGIKFNGAKSKYMVFKGRNGGVFNIDIYVNGDVVARVTSADHLCHHISWVDNTSTIQAAEAHLWKSFFWLLLGTVIQLSKISILNSVGFFMTPHFGVDMAITAVEFVLLGERLWK